MHISETKLELFAVDPGKFSEEESAEIEAHLKECRWCSEMLEQLLETYENFAQEQAHQAEVHGRARLENHLPILRDVHNTSVQVTPDGKPTRFVRVLSSYIKQHPIASGATVSFAVLLVLALLSWRGAFTSPNPHQAVAKDGFLRVYDEKGQELWARFMDQSYSWADTISWEGARSVLAVCDVDGDGRNEVLAVLGWKPSFQNRNTVACFKRDGSLLWEYRVHRNMNLGGRAYSDDFRCVRMVSGDFDHDGKQDLAVVALHFQWEPSVILLLDAATGGLTGEYWHFGHISEVVNRDLDGDGVDEIVACGLNGVHNQTSLVVLHPRGMNGQAPLQEERRSKDFSLGTEKYYVLLPRSDLRMVSAGLRPEVGRLHVTAKRTVSLTSSETFGGTAYGLIFEFDGSMKCISVRAADNFLGFHQKLEREGLLREPVEARYLEKLRKEVQYWDGEKFVKEAIVNRRYLEIAKK